MVEDLLGLSLAWLAHAHRGGMKQHQAESGSVQTIDVPLPLTYFHP